MTTPGRSLTTFHAGAGFGATQARLGATQTGLGATQAGLGATWHQSQIGDSQGTSITIGSGPVTDTVSSTSVTSIGPNGSSMSTR